VTQVGLADAVAPGTAGALWLTSYPPDADPGTAAGTAREVSSVGVSLGPPLRLPAGYLIDQATNRGLLLAPVAPRPGAMACQLRDPAAPQASRTFDAVIAVSTTQIAWAPPCRTVRRAGAETGHRAAGNGRADRGEIGGLRTGSAARSRAKSRCDVAGIRAAS
jgi:hypothetical protein